MKDVILALLKGQATQTVFLKQLAADVMALKAVVCAFDREHAPSALEEQIAIAQGKLDAVFQVHLKEIERLERLVSKLPSPKPN